MLSSMPKVDAIPHLQKLVQSHVEAASACELGRVADLHRSTVLRFCKTGRATSATAQKLTAAMAALSSAHGSAGEEAVASNGGVLGHAATRPHQVPQELMSLRVMLQALISLIDGQYGPVDLPVGRNVASTSAMSGG